MRRRLACSFVTCAVFAAFGPGLVLAQSGPAPVQATPVPVVASLSVDPDQAGASPQWSVTIPAQYCGGWRVGDGVYLSPEAPLALPDSVSDASVQFSGSAATATMVDGALRIALAPGQAQSMICMTGDRGLTVTVLSSAGFALPSAGGDYTLDVWTGADATPTSLTVSVPASDDGSSGG